jgi:tetratricopeptide (TPR) repeat protein
MSERPLLPKSGVRKFFDHPGARTLVLWVLLLGMFLALWVVLQPSPGSSRASLPSAEEAPAAEVGLAARLGMYLPGLALFGIFMAWGVRRTRGFTAANAAGLKALAEGDYAKAATHLEGAARRYRWPAMYRAVGSFNLGLARLYEGRLAEALERFEDAERRSNRMLNIKANIAVQLALTNALRGSIEPARKWRSEAEALVKTAPDPATVGGLLAFVTAVIDVRERRYDEFVRWLDDGWARLEGSLTARTTRPLRALRAFALAQSGGARNAGVAQKALEALKPVREGEFALLEAEWPEMRAFLRVHED